MPNFNPINPYHNISLTAFWQHQLTPALPLLADISHLSIPQVQHALPHLLKGLTLQMQQNCKLQHNSLTPNQNEFITAIKNGTLQNLPLQNLAQDITKNGLNFTQLPKIVNFTVVARQMLFSDSHHYQQILGLLAQRTGLAIPRIEILLAWTSLLCFTSLHHLSVDIETTVLNNWLLAQSEIGFNATDNALLALYHQQFYSNAPARFEQLHHFSKETIITLMSHPNQRQLFAIAPQLPSFAQQPVSTLSSPSRKPPQPSNLFSQPTLTTADTIFTPKAIPKLSLAKLLQKYWIATSIVLTGLVFGVVALFSANNPKPMPEAVASTDKPIHDVAIMKIDSSPAPTANTVIANPKVTATSKATSPSTPKVVSDTHSKESKSIASKSKSDSTAISIKAKLDISTKAKIDNTKPNDKKAVDFPTKTTEKSDNKKETSKKTN